ncbi:MAG: trypsin-like peptidase domain-containing protein [Pirellulales bacterium]|nr:trypsin-like peptidase domain-containing protein [Pirellulales bacterium]
MPQTRCLLWPSTPVSRFLLVLILVPLLGGLLPGRARSQAPLPTSPDNGNAKTPESRADLYRTLRQHAPTVNALSETVKAVAKLTKPAVVHIEADVETRSGRTYGGRHLEEAGSGVIIQRGGDYYVLTNRHVVQSSSPKGIKINLADGRQIHPDRVWKHADTDIAVMSVSASGLVAAPVGNSDETEIGDFVLAVGSPFGLSHSMTFGMVSAKSRRDLELGDTTVVFQDFIQTDAAINPGNSGGPLVNLRGEIVGINTAIASNSGGNEGIGFAIPINMFMFFSQQLIERGKVTRAFLGVRLDQDFSLPQAAEIGLSAPIGARVVQVFPETPAESADLRIGDVILKFNGVDVEDDTHLINLVGLTKVGTRVSLVVFRDRNSFPVEVEVGTFSPRR